MKEKIFLCAIAILLFTLSMCFAAEFNDVPKEHWAYEYVNKLSNESIINGFEDGTFRPSEKLTKAQFIKLMVSSDELLVKKMNDLLSNSNVNRQWFENYFDVAEEYNLLPDGYDKNDLNSYISRKDMAEILSNFIKFVSVYNSLDYNEQSKLKKELDNNPEFINDSLSDFLVEIDTKLSDSFADVLDLDKRSQENIYIVKDLGIINGYEDGTFKPNNFVTRAEASKVISKYIDEAGLGIIISNMIYNETKDVISSATSKIDSIATSMFNSKFEQYAGTQKSKAVANSLISMVLSSNNSSDNKINIELKDNNDQIIIDEVSIKNAINNTNNVLFDISFSKDSNGIINKTIIKANAPINTDTVQVENPSSNTNSNSLQPLEMSYNNILKNNKGEIIKYIYNGEFKEFSYTNLTINDVINFLGKDAYIDKTHIEFRKINTFNGDYSFDVPSDAEYMLYCLSYMREVPIDFYKESSDRTTLISLKRGSDYDFVVESNTYSFEDYVNDTFDIDSNLSGIFKTNDNEILMLKRKNGDGIIYSNKEDYFMDCYCLVSIELNNLIHYPYPLQIYFESNDISKVKAIYQLPNYANYFTGLIEYNDGKVEWLTVSSNTGNNKREVEVKLKEIHNKVQNATLNIIEEYSRGISTAR